LITPLLAGIFAGAKLAGTTPELPLGKLGPAGFKGTPGGAKTGPPGMAAVAIIGFGGMPGLFIGTVPRGTF
jgi:hypothetical protein